MPSSDHFNTADFHQGRNGRGGEGGSSQWGGGKEEGCRIEIFFYFVLKKKPHTHTNLSFNGSKNKEK